MKTGNKPVEILLETLQERAKELNCIYAIEELVNNPDRSVDEIFNSIVRVIPAGWQYPDICVAQITFEDKTIESEGFVKTPWVMQSEILVRDKLAGYIAVYYTESMPQSDEGPFLKEERKLLNTISDRLGHFLLHRKLKNVFNDWELARKEISEKREAQWRVVLELLRRTDPKLYMRISRKMMNYLCWSGINEAEKLIQRYGENRRRKDGEPMEDINRPSQKTTLEDSLALGNETFELAANYLGDQEVFIRLQKWIQEDKLSFMVKTLDNLDTPLNEIVDALTRYHHVSSEGMEFSPPVEKGILVSLIRRFFADQLDFINIAKQYLNAGDFYELIQRVIYPPDSHGKLGGKSAGLFLANHILKKTKTDSGILQAIKTPKTWHITSDGIINFIFYNNLEEVLEQKYKDIDQVRWEYAHIIQVFKNSHFPPEIIKGLSLALDEFGDSPLIVRSSSLLEDRLGSAFAGKYKSLFLANQGTKQQRLDALMDAIAEVYASTFGPDPIEYRSERGLLDFHEEMGIMIQEVVGTRIGHYYLPAYSGVAFSKNEFRWSPRIKRDDGLIRLVPGLGTRAVDRLSDDYPVLIAPGQPGLRANVTYEETMRYAPKKVDLINLETNTFETISLDELIRRFGDQIPQISKIVSICEDSRLKRPSDFDIDPEKLMVVTFDGLVSRTSFIDKIQAILKVLQEKLNTPVDIEFASDGDSFYLLQCRPQSYSKSDAPAPIPKDVEHKKIIFSAKRFVSNGKVPDITHIVYVDPRRYNELASLEELNQVGKVVGKLNSILPKRQFILMGPGRWGSRGDIKLGVNVGYSEINNTAVLIEIARKKGNYIPDLSFGTHFFQDLVEGGIRYLPLYPDDDDITFNEWFLTHSENMLPHLMPDYEHLAETIHVIDVPKTTRGQVLRILMNADLDEALGYLTTPSAKQAKPKESEEFYFEETENHWRWRLRMAEHIASQLDAGRFGIEAFYVFGSTKNATAGPGSDIDLLIHFKGTELQKKELLNWLEGWSLCISEINFLRTGYKSDGLLDVHLVTDEDIAKKTSFAVKIGAVTDAARPLMLKKKR